MLIFCLFLLLSLKNRFNSFGSAWLRFLLEWKKNPKYFVSFVIVDLSSKVLGADCRHATNSRYRLCDSGLEYEISP